MRSFAALLTAFILGGTLATEAIKFRSEQVLISPNGRFEMRLVCTDDGCHLIQVDTVKDRMSVMEVTAEDGAIIGIGERKNIQSGAYRAAMKEWQGFVEWGHGAEVVP